MAGLSFCFINEFFDELNKENGWSGRHAKNGGEVSVGGFWLDYYEPNLNLVIEWDERHHKYPKKKKQDELCVADIALEVNQLIAFNGFQFGITTVCRFCVFSNS